MKRSDMIKMMVQIQLNPPKNIREMNDGAAQIVRLMDYMLFEMEEAGMLPPFVDLDKPVGDKDYFTLHVDQAAYAGLCEWESEDEDLLPK